VQVRDYLKEYDTLDQDKICRSREQEAKRINPALSALEGKCHSLNEKVGPFRAASAQADVLLAAAPCAQSIECSAEHHVWRRSEV
jgi:hypothetical protein